MKLEHIQKMYQNKNNRVIALKDINLDFNENGLIVLLGPSGCGKTTLLNILGKKDLSYEGTVSDVPHLIYLTQEVQLIESMSVFDNLLIANQDKHQIVALLNKYGLYEHRNKKVKKCSQGQKKRIQFIRALLMKPGLLLCDEPTAALDHDNSELLMKELKEISKEIQVIVVTHDIALSQQYGDRILKIDRGNIVEDTIIQQGSLSSFGEAIPKKTMKETMKLVMKSFLARPIELLFLLGLSLLVAFSVYFTINIIQTTERQTSINEGYNNSENLILSLPNVIESRVINDPLNYTRYYHDFDLYSYNEIQELIKDYPEIVGVEAYYHEQYSPRTALYYRNMGSNRDTYFTFNVPVDLTENPELSPGKFLVIHNKPEHLPYLIMMQSQKFKYGVENPSMNEYDLSVFSLVDDNENIPLIYGEYPKNPEEVVLSRNVAEVLLDLKGLKSLEELLNEPMRIGVKGTINLQRKYFPEAEEIELKITGISAIKNSFMNMVFMNGDMKSNPIMNRFINNFDKVGFDYVHFLIKPGSDYKAIAKKMNEELPKDQNQFICFEGKGLGEDQKVYNNPAQFLLFGVGAIGTTGALMLITYLFMRKRMKKENSIIADLGYRVSIEKIVRLTIFFVVTALLCLAIFNPLIKEINLAANKMYYSQFMSYQPLIIILVSIVVVCCQYFLEYLFTRGKR